VNHPVSELTAYLDGALPAAERAQVESHLAGCAACRAERDRLASALALLSRLPPAPAPAAGFEQRFFARLAREKATLRERRSLLDRVAWRWLVPTLAGALATAAVILYSGERRREHEVYLAEHLDLFQNYELVAGVGAVDTPDDVNVVAHLDQLEPEGRP
jgi:anti-sigma factor RsiW